VDKLIKWGYFIAYIEEISVEDIAKRPFGCNFIFNIEAPYLTDIELKSEYKAVVR